MNVFVLGTGRCGTTTFVKACRHATNFTCAHESRINLVGQARLAYPANHIEADNRLSWMLGRLEQTYGDKALYVHLLRDEDAMVSSYLKRWKSERSIVYGYRTSILPNPDPAIAPEKIVRDMCRSINQNIRLFLKDKSRVTTVHLETAGPDFRRFWAMAGLGGDIEAALAEWDKAWNAAAPPPPDGLARLGRIPAKLGRIARKLPGFLDRA